MERIITIELFGELYKFKAESEVENVDDVAGLLMQEVEKAGSGMKGPRTDVLKFAQLLLAALNISSEYIKLKQNHDSFVEELSKRSSSLVKTLDEAMIR